MVGDLAANVEKLKAQLRHVRYPLHQLDSPGLMAGRPTAVLPVLHYTFLGFSALFAKFLSEKGYELHAKSDLRFLESAYRVLREHLSYSPALTTSQFFSSGFAERKVLLCQDVLRLVRKFHSELSATSAHSQNLKSLGRSARADMFADKIDHMRDQQRILPQPATVNDVAEEGLGLLSCPWREGAESSDHVELFAEIGETQHQQLPSIWEEGVQPQPPPLPTPFEPAGSSYVPEAVAPTMGLTELQYFETVNELKDLLEHIKSSVMCRFDCLEKRFDQYVEEAEAKRAILQGEVKILATRLREALPTSHDDLSAAPVQTDSFPHLGVMPCTSAIKSVPKDVPLSAPDRCGAFTAKQPKNIAPEVVPKSSSNGGLASAALQAMSPVNSVIHERQYANVLSACTSTPLRLVPHPEAIEQSPSRSPCIDSAAIQQDTEVLISQLTDKFKDTQDLLHKQSALVGAMADAASNDADIHGTHDGLQRASCRDME
jgi:centrosomal protein CEP44